MQKFKLIYLWDAYCGWCYAFEPALSEFIEQHPEIEFTAFSGGLMVEDRVSAIGELGFLKDANARISDLLGTVFGASYNQVLEEGSMILNSTHPAAALAAYRPHLHQSELLDFMYKIQQSFFIDGQSLSQATTYLPIAEQYGLENLYTEEALQSLMDHEVGASEDFAITQQFGVSSYPTVLLFDGETFYDLRRGALSSAELEQNYQSLTIN